MKFRSNSSSRFGYYAFPPIAAIVLFGILTFLSLQSVRRSETATARAHLAVATVRSLVRDLVDAETGQRGYLLTNQVSYLEPFHSARGLIQKDVLEVEAISRELKVALPISELSEQSQERLEQLDKTVALKLEGKSSEALDYLQSGVGKVTMDKIREVTTNMEGELKKKILESDRESTSAYFNAIVLDVSRIGRHKITLNRIQLAMIETIEHLIEDYRQAQSNRVIEFDRSEIRSELFAFADKTRIVQSVTNLLHNACKFSQEDQPIQVRVTRDRASTDQIAISVTDLGTGLEPCDLDEIFLLFHQSNVTIDRSQGGLGIGLTLAKGLVEMHGGTIRAASRGLGHGSTFTINLPLAELQAMRSQNDNLGAGRTSVSQSKPKYRILAIDDWMDALLPLRVLITKAGHDFAEAKDGQSGFDMAVVYSPDIVLCDIGLPGSMNGLDVARKFRLHATLRSAYMVALSGYSQPSDHVKSAEAGFDFHVAKPINARVLNDLIDARPRFPKATSNSIQA